MATETRYEVNQPDVVDESVDGEVLIVHLGTGAYYSSRGPGDLAWQLIARGASLQELVAATGSAPASIEAFIGQLVDEGLVRERATPPEPLPAVQPLPGDLLLEKYTDMQELLLLDPIHDVEEAGWPKAKQPAET